MKRAFIVHGWQGSPEDLWYPWMKRELEKAGFQVFAPVMPDSDHPKMEAWVRKLAKAVASPDEECYFVGHSLGCITILRYIESLRGMQKVGGAVLVAGFASNLGYDEIGSFFKKPIRWAKIRSRCKRFVAVHSDNDPYVSLHYGDIFKEKLGAGLVVKLDMSHFNRMKTIPVALDSVVRISKNRG
jgi:uncharacterized protein